MMKNTNNVNISSFFNYEVHLLCQLIQSWKRQSGINIIIGWKKRNNILYFVLLNGIGNAEY